MSYDGPRFPSLTPAIKQLLLLNAAVFAANALLLGRLSTPTAEGGCWLAFSLPLALEGFGLGALRVLTYQFTHSFADPWHFLGNMLVLYFMGTIAEQRLGYRGTLKLYVLGGLFGAAAHLALALTQGYADVPLIGASGACYAFLVYAACRAPHALVFQVVPLWLVAALLVFIGAYSTFVELATGYGSGSRTARTSAAPRSASCRSASSGSSTGPTTRALRERACSRLSGTGCDGGTLRRERAPRRAPSTGSTSCSPRSRSRASARCRATSVGSSSRSAGSSSARLVASRS